MWWGERVLAYILLRKNMKRELLGDTGLDEMVKLK
jgi:hypothetical protein